MNIALGSALAIPLLAVVAGCVATGPEPDSVVPRAAHAVTGLETATGSFVGVGGHETSGTASVFWTGSEWVVSLGSDFASEGGPAAVVGLGNDGVYDPASTLGPLQAAGGAQVYPLTPGLDIGDYLQVYVWSEALGAPLGVADLRLL